MVEQWTHKPLVEGSNSLPRHYFFPGHWPGFEKIQEQEIKTTCLCVLHKQVVFICRSVQTFNWLTT